MGVVLVGVVVILIVVTAGMVSTTWVQFIKGALLIVFSTVLTVTILYRGLSVEGGGVDGYQFRAADVFVSASRSVSDADIQDVLQGFGEKLLPVESAWKGLPYLRSQGDEGRITTWRTEEMAPNLLRLREGQTITKTPNGEMLINGLGQISKSSQRGLHPVGHIARLPGNVSYTGPLGPVKFLETLQQSEIVLWSSQKVTETDGSVTTIYYPRPTPGKQVLSPGESPTFAGIRSRKLSDKLNFLSLMLALFCGTASLPHILIRYYTVKDEAAARKSTIVGIACIGFFYVLTLYMGLGAMTSGALDVTDSNMAAPLLARSISELLFAIISAIAFTTVLGTVSGLILASAGAVTHDLLESIGGVHLTDYQRVRIAKFASVIVGLVAIALGILFKELNVTYLVGWAFSVAASANLPALVMLLFWKKTTRQGIITAVIVGMVSSLAWILLSGDTYASVYGLPKENSIVPFSQPGIVTIPLGFITLIVVSLFTQPRMKNVAA
jgi:cation/acetate symporter